MAHETLRWIVTIRLISTEDRYRFGMMRGKLMHSEDRSVAAWYDLCGVYDRANSEKVQRQRNLNQAMCSTMYDMGLGRRGEREERHCDLCLEIHGGFGNE